MTLTAEYLRERLRYDPETVLPCSQNVANCSLTEGDYRATDSVNPKENQVTIRIEITGDNASQVASQLLTFTATMSQLLTPRAPATEAAHQGPAPDTVVETVAEQPAAPARRGRPRKSETIEHEPKEVQDVHREPGAGADDGGDAGSGAGAGAVGGEPGAASGIAAERMVSEAADEAPAGVDAVAETDTDAPAAAPATEAVNVDDLRKHIIADYLNAFFPSQEVRKAKFAEILDVYGATKLSEVPADRLGEVKALVDGKIAALAGAK